MLLEVSPEERLVGEMKAVRDFLYTQCRGFQHRLYFQYHMTVDDVFGGGAGHVLYHGGEVTWTDAKPVGIEGNFALAGTLFVYGLDK